MCVYNNTCATSRMSLASLRICIVSSSLAERSRSHLAVTEAVARMEAFGIQVDVLKLSEAPRELYHPAQGPDAVREDFVRRFNAADGWLLAGGVYNYGPNSALLNFLHSALDPEGRRHRPFGLLVGSGGVRSLLAYSGVAATMLHETHGVQVGPPVCIAGDEADLTAGRLREDVRQRVGELCRVLVCMTHASKALTAPVAPATATTVATPEPDAAVAIS